MFGLDEEISKLLDNRSFRRTENRSNLKSWGSLNRVNDSFFDDSFFDDKKIWDSLKRRPSQFARDRIERFFKNFDDDFLTTKPREDGRRDWAVEGRGVTERPPRCYGRTYSRTSDTSEVEKSSSANSAFSITSINDLNKNENEIYENGCRRKSSSYQGNVTFPTSSSSNISETSSSRPTSRMSNASTCTQRTVDTATVSEKIPNGIKTKTTDNASWITKSPSGSTIAENTVSDDTITEKAENRCSEKNTRKTSYLEKTKSGSSVQEDTTTESSVSCEKTGNSEHKISESTTSSVRRGIKPNKSSFYDELDSTAFPSLFTKREERGSQKRRNYSSNERIRSLVEEALNMKMPADLQTDMEKVSSIFETKGFEDRSKRGSVKSRSTSSGAAEDTSCTKEKYNELKKELTTLQQENSKLQAIIQDVTSVNKRWQQYNNDRQVYVQKLLQTIQDLQEQINLSSENKVKETLPHDDKKHYEQIEKKYQETIENLKREHINHSTMLQLQLNTYKKDWEAEKHDKLMAVEEKQKLERRLEEIMKEHKSHDLPQPSPITFCSTIQPKTYRTLVHVPFSSCQQASNATSLYFEDEVVKDTSSQYISERELASDIPLMSSEESYVSEEYKNNSSSYNHDSGIALSFTEKYPTTTYNITEEQNQTKPNDNSFYKNQIKMKDSYEKSQVSLGFFSDGLANVTTFNTSDCSSQNKSGDRSIASWDGVDTETRDDIICPNCDTVFPPPSHLQFLRHFELCQPKSNGEDNS